MKKKKNNIIAGSLLLIALMAGCSSGTGNNTTKATPPTGPVNYEAIKAKFNTNYIAKTNNSMSLVSDAPGGSCGSILSGVGDRIGMATGYLSMIPAAGTALGLIASTTGGVLGLLGGDKASSCITNEFANIEYQLSIQQNQINNIESYLALSNNNLWNAMAGNASNTQNADYTAFSGSINRITGDGGLFNSVYSTAGFYNDLLQITGFTLSQLESSQANLTKLAAAYIDMQTTGDYLDSISNIAGSQLNVGSSSQCDLESGIPACYNNVTQNPNSQLMNLLSATHSALQDNLVASLNNGNNVVPLLDDYNNTLVAYYQQGLAAIQEAYHLAYLANYLNYFQSVPEPQYLGDFLLVAGTYYSPTSGVDYNTAQKNLTLMAAAMVNQLYQNVSSYIITDVPIGSQAYPNNQSIPYVNESGTIVYNSPHTINYSKIGESASTALQVLTHALAQTTVPATNAGNTIMVESVLATNLTTLGTGPASSLLFYQYSGINNVGSCIGNLESYNLQYGQNGTLSGAINSQSCPSLLVDVNESPVNQSVLTPYTIQPYAISPNVLLPVLSGNVTNNVNPIACSPTPNGSIPAYNLYWYTPSSAYPSLGIPGTPYLMCGNWNVNASSIYSKGNNSGGIVLSSAWIYSGMLWASIDASLPTTINFPELMSSSVMAIDTNAVWAQPSGTSLSPDALGNIGMSLPAIQSVNVYSNWPSYDSSKYQGTFHVAAVQTTLLDGFIAPYGVTINNYEGMYIGAFSNQSFKGAVTFGLSYNPNVLSAGVTINGQPLYDTSDINANVVPWDQAKTAQLTINGLNWAPVTSSNLSTNVSTVMINGNRLVTVGGITKNQNDYYEDAGGNVSVCVVNLPATNPYHLGDTSNSTLNNSNPVPAVVSYYDNCLQGTGAGILDTNTSLWAAGNNSITSQNGKYTLLLQTDGNLVLYSDIYTPSQAVVWASNTAGTGSNNQLAMQSQGNLVLYSGSTVVWQPPVSMIGTGASNYLAVQNDGNLVLYSGPNLTNPIWATGTAQQ